jgi:hypothetical protein
MPTLHFGLAPTLRNLGATLAVLALTMLVPPAAASPPDPAPFDTLLRAHVKAGVVDYAAFHGNAAFRGYAAALGAPFGEATRDERLAAYLNAYNVFAIQGILDGLSPSSFLGRQRYFKLQTWTIDGRPIALERLENDVIRPFKDPRIHFAIVCASKSCPPLRGEAYVADRLDAQLEDQARRFVNDPSKNRFDKGKRTAYLSAIFKWFDEDFRGAGSVQKYLARYVADGEIARGLANDAYEVEWIEYDWTLNGPPPKR